MKNKILCLLLGVSMSMPLVGCNANVQILGKDVLKVEEKTEEEKVTQEQPIQEKQVQKGFPQYDEEEVLAVLLTGEYTLYVDEIEYVYNTEDVLIALYENPNYIVEQYEGNQYLIQVSDEKGNNFTTFLVDCDSMNISIVEVYYNNELYEDVDANEVFPYIIYEEIFNEEDGTLTKKQQQTKEEQKTSSENKEKQSKEEIPQGTCIYCNGKLDSDDKKSVCKSCVKNIEEKNNEQQKVNCEYCGKQVDEGVALTWNGCCSELCAINRDGEVYEEMERNNEIGGQTLCGWCEIPIDNGGAFCSESCEQEHHAFYGVN